MRRVQDQADRLAHMAHLRGTATRRVRDGLLRALEARKGVAEHLVRSTQQEDPAALRTLVATLRRSA